MKRLWTHLLLLVFLTTVVGLDVKMRHCDGAQGSVDATMMGMGDDSCCGPSGRCDCDHSSACSSPQSCHETCYLSDANRAEKVKAASSSSRRLPGASQSAALMALYGFLPEATSKNGVPIHYPPRSLPWHTRGPGGLRAPPES